MVKDLIAALLVLTFAMVVGCNKPSNDGVSSQGVVDVEDDDPEMLAAIKTAKETLAFFEKNWQTMNSDGYSLKFAMPTSDGSVEHIWFSPTKIERDKITGECANEPVSVPGLKLGDTRTVARDDVSDWMIIVGDKCYGGYTLRVLLERDPEVAPPFDFIDPPSR